MSAGTSVAVYGLSTEGYRIASSIAIKGSKVSLIDESVRMAISLKPDIARTYPNVSSLVEDEPLLDLEPIDVAVSNASYVYFAPRVRKVGPEVKSDVTSKFKDAIKALKRGASVVYMLPFVRNPITSPRAGSSTMTTRLNPYSLSGENAATSCFTGE